MEKKIKVLYVTQAPLRHYRVPIFRLVNSNPNIDLTLAHCGKDIIQHDMPEILLKKEKYGPFSVYKDFEKICDGYNVILCMFYYDNISVLTSVLRKKRKIILWSIGVPSSYNRQFGEASKLRYKIMNFFQRRADALIFYSDAPLEILRKKGVHLDEEKVFFANNTVEVIQQPIITDSKKSLLFIGTLYLEKGLQLLLDAYKEAYKTQADLLPLNIVGDGAQMGRIKKWITNEGLENKIIMLGPIYDTHKKAEIFGESIACISPKQAGLSVLESMGYGVPFITSEKAITGGEAFNIASGENGLLLKDLAMLKDVILDIHKNRDKYLYMGEKAHEYYWNKRTPDAMATGIISAINYAYQANE